MSPTPFPPINAQLVTMALEAADALETIAMQIAPTKIMAEVAGMEFSAETLRGLAEGWKRQVLVTKLTSDLISSGVRESTPTCETIASKLVELHGWTMGGDGS